MLQPLPFHRPSQGWETENRFNTKELIGTTQWDEYFPSTKDEDWTPANYIPQQ